MPEGFRHRWHYGSGLLGGREIRHRAIKYPLVRCWDAAVQHLRPQYSGKDLYILHLVHRYLYDFDKVGKRLNDLREPDRERYLEIKRLVKAKVDEIWPKFMEDGK